MKFTKLLFSTFAGALCLAMQSCGNSSPDETIHDVIAYDDFDIEEVKELNADDYDFIFLSNDNPDCLVSNITKVAVTDNRIYLIDGFRATETRLLAFDSEGKAIGPVGSRGQGPEEFARMSEFYIGANGNINLCCIEKELKFDHDGKFISSQSMDKRTVSAVELPDGSLLVSIAPWDQSDAANCSLVRTGADYSLIDSILPKDESYDPNYSGGGGKIVANGNGEYAFSNNFSNDIYILGQDAKVKRIITLDFGANNISESLKKNMDNYALLDECRYLRGPVYYSDDKLAFTLSDKGTKRLVTLNLKDKTGKSIEAHIPFIGESGFHNGYPILDIACYENDMIDLPDSLRRKIEEKDLYFIALHK